LLDAARGQGGHPLSTVLGYGERTSPMFAAMINAAQRGHR
jgi:2-methylcitrate dehydratase PrpD